MGREEERLSSNLARPPNQSRSAGQSREEVSARWPLLGYAASRRALRPGAQAVLRCAVWFALFPRREVRVAGFPIRTGQGERSQLRAFPLRGLSFSGDSDALQTKQI